MSNEPDHRIAPPGKIWMCAACGKKARDRFGIEGWHSRGWDESCMLNAVLVDEDTQTQDNTGDRSE